MKSIIKLFICGIFCFSLSHAFGQQLGLSTQILYFPSQSCIGCTDTFTVQVKNLDSASYTGYINIYTSHDTTAFSVAALCSIPQITIAGLGSIQNTCSITFDSTYFNTGNNIVVVWSSGNAKSPADTAGTHVLLTLAGIHEFLNSFSFSLIPSITNNFIQIKLSNQDIFLEHTRILDIFGREVNSVSILKHEKKNLVDVSRLTSGIYFLEVSSGNLRNTRKFVKID